MLPEHPTVSHLLSIFYYISKAVKLEALAPENIQ